MHNKNFLSLVIIISLLCVFLYPKASVAYPASLFDQPIQGITILIDENDDNILQIGYQLRRTLLKFNYPTKMVLVSNAYDIRKVEWSDKQSLALVYLFHGSKTGLDEYGLSWLDLANLISISSVSHHVVLTCYSSNLNDYFKNGTSDHYIYTVNDTIDVEVAKLEALGRISEILRALDNRFSQKVGVELFNYVREYTINNFPKILVRLLIPGTPMVSLPEKSGFSGPAGFVMDLILSLVKHYLQSQGLLFPNGTINFGTNTNLEVAQEFSLDVGGSEFPLNVSVGFSFDISIDGTFSAGASISVSKEQTGHLGKIMNIIGTKITGSGEFSITGQIVDTPVVHLELQNFEFSISFEVTKSLDVKEIIRSVAPKSVADVISAIQKYVGLDISASISFGGSFQVSYDFQKDITEMTVSVWFGSELSVTIAIVTFSAGVNVNLDFNFSPYGNSFTATFLAYAQADVDFEFATLHFSGDFSLTWVAGPEDKEGQQMNIDSDNDGLPDNFELSIGTNPLSADSDNDGIPDGIEIYDYHTDPKVNDTDHDFIADGPERDWYESHGCEPLGDVDNDGLPNLLDNDSDGDGVLDGLEIFVYNSDPLMKDTDGDQLEDGKEVSIETSPTLSDSDHDFIGDFEEINLGLDPNNNDTDNDGLLDGFEEYVLGTNPNNNDTDGDGLSDGSEYFIYGTDPLVVDTDGDGLSDGAEVFNFNTLPTNIDTDADNISDADELNGWYVTVKNSSGTYTFKVYSDPTINDTDGDGLSDGFERTFRSNPTCNDTDGDGLSDYDEAAGIIVSGVGIVFTDPADYDTDGDGLSDGYEVAHNSDPTDDDTDDDYLDDGTENAIGTSTTNPDTDNDGILDGLEYDYLNKTRKVDPKTHDADGDGTIDILDNDSDNDTLIDGDELMEYYTDPLNNDTDHDGASDSDEILNLKTDPLNPDTDGDGLLDGTITNPNSFNGVGEGNVGTQPLDNDTDNDGLLDGEEIIVSPTGWSTYTNPLNPDTDGDKILDGHELEIYTDPLNFDTDGDGLWDGSEVNGVNVTGFVPQYYEIGPFYTDPLDNDTDNDGLDDGSEVYHYRTDPTNPDFDGDGLTDGVEVLFYNTSPTNADTDFDNVTDYEEIFNWNWAVIRIPLNYFEQEPPGSPEPPKNEDNIPHQERESVVIRYISYEVQRFKYRVTPFRGKYYTDPLDPDTDDDMLSDGEEKKLATNPNNNDTDHDGLLDGAEVKLYFTNPRIPDCDFDGLLDGYEINVSNTDPLKNDTDNDGLTDYEEVIIWNTNPQLNDTDNDGLTDYLEIHGANVIIYNLTVGNFVLTKIKSNPLDNDTDGDGLIDSNEIFLYHSNPLSKDTDGDELNDSAEVYLYNTNVTNFDSDRDGLLDGLEINYGKNPLDPDENNDGIPDGKTFDYDNDTISDYDEVYVYHTYIALVDSDTDGLPDPWEIRYNSTNPRIADSTLDPDNDNLSNMEELIYSTNPDLSDTDNDGLSDGLEVKVYHTNPTNPDSDGDNMNDLFEINHGLDPNTADTTPPSIESVEIPSDVVVGDNVTISAIVNDDSGVSKVILLYNDGYSWNSKEMQSFEGKYVATIYNIQPTKYMFKIVAIDYSGNTNESIIYSLEPLTLQPSQGTLITEILIGVGIVSLSFAVIVFFFRKRLGKGPNIMDLKSPKK
ncbi:MAG: hypothetical protein ACP6IS_10500 [Candidatus Asgardarchaeia archaeon]